MKKSHFQIFVFLTSVFLSNLVLSQQQDFISGKLLDVKTQEPIVFANVYLENRNLGVISNVDGGFKIPIQYKKMGNILIISSMGYQRKEVQISDLTDNIVNIISLEPAVFELSEAFIKAKKKRVKKLTAKNIVKIAINAIPENYPTEAYSQVGYYRDYQLYKNEYVNLNEAILEVFDLGFKTIDSATTKVSLYDYHQNEEFKIDSLASLPYNYNLDQRKGGKIIDKAFLSSYAGNEFTILSVHNAIRNYKLNTFSFVYQLETDFLNGHVFSKENDTYINGEALHSIKIYKNKDRYRAYGRLLISKSDFSIYKMDYSLYDDTKKNATGFKDKNGSENLIIFSVNTSYREKDDKMFLNYISFRNNFTIQIPPVFKLTYVDFKINYDRMRMRKNNMKVNLEEVPLEMESFFELSFTTKVDEQSASKLKNFKAYFLGERIHFKKLKVVGKKVRLYPRVKSPVEQQMIKDIELYALNRKLNEQTLKFSVTNIKDVHGNVVNQWETKDYNQFREFFVQRVKKNSKSPIQGLFMRKDRPIFHDQPITRPDNFDDYWMNTPLQKIAY